MSHLRVTRDEFARQAESFAGAPLLSGADLTDQVAEAAVGARDWRVLDLACGPGLLLPSLAARAQRVVGVDFTPEVLTLARRRIREDSLQISLVRGVAETLPFHAASFDAVVLRLALHHFEKPSVVLREVKRLLRPRGRLVVVDILTSGDHEVAGLYNAIERLRDRSHVQLVPEGELIAAIETEGFRLSRRMTWNAPRGFVEWAKIISDEPRMRSLEAILRHLARAGVTAGIDLREEGGELLLTYTFALLVAELDRSDNLPV